MALVNRAWRESRFVPEGAQPGLYDGRTFQENVQNLAVQDIVKTRFAYPSVEEPDLKSYANRPEHTIGVRLATGELLFPDIVVMDKSTTEVRMLAEVETERSLHDPDVAEKLRAFASTGRLFLYVPLSNVDRARRLLQSANVRLAGLRSWRYNIGQRTLDVLELPL